MTCGSDIRERNWVNSIRDRILPQPLLAGPELTLGQKAAIIQKAGLVIANDSDLLHIGLALKCPAIGIFGPTDYQLVATYGEEVDLTAFYRPIDCRPCVNIHCADPVCMKSITPETVLESASKTIESLMSLRTVKKRG